MLFPITLLLTFRLLTATVFAQENTTSSTTLPFSPEAPSVLKVCGANTPPPCGTPPRLIKSKDPKYASEARKRHIEGRCVLWLIVGADGLPRDIRIARSLGYGLDEEAVKAVRRWRFQPSTLDGHPVSVQINVEVNFRLR
jgi:TonB family protein